MPRFPGLRRLSSVSDYKPKHVTVKDNQIIEEVDRNENEDKKQKMILTTESKDNDLEAKDREEKEQFAVKQLREFILSHPKITNPITGKLIIFCFPKDW